MKYIYKSKNGHYYCGNCVSSNDINSAEIFNSNLYLFGSVSDNFERIPFKQELRKQKLLEIKKYVVV